MKQRTATGHTVMTNKHFHCTDHCLDSSIILRVLAVLELYATLQDATLSLR